MRALHIPLRAVFYREGDLWLAHCLEMDVIGDGGTRDQALQQLNEAISIQIESSLELNNPANLFQPADAKYFAMFAAGRDFAVGQIALHHSNGIHIDRLDTREYQTAESDRDAACA